MLLFCDNVQHLCQATERGRDARNAQCVYRLGCRGTEYLTSVPGVPGPEPGHSFWSALVRHETLLHITRYSYSTEEENIARNLTVSQRIEEVEPTALLHVSENPPFRVVQYWTAMSIQRLLLMMSLHCIKSTLQRIICKMGPISVVATRTQFQGTLLKC
jgi:hypothetical protein